jgi:hypothetical protein
MPNLYYVGIQLMAEDSDALLERLEVVNFEDAEGITSITQQPESIAVPPHLSPTVPPPQPPTGRALNLVNPAEGPVSGGITITLHGSGFTGIGGVRFERDGQTGWADAFEVIDDLTMTCNTPQMSAGPVDVIAFDGDLGDAVLANGFTYIEEA